MASIRKEILVDNTPERVWDALRDVGKVHERVAPGFVVATQMEEGARVVTFGNGMTARELIVSVDDDSRRVVWAVVGSPRLTHHNASVQVFPEGKGCRVVWIADLLPNEAAGDIAGMIEAGMGVMKPTLEQHLQES